MIFKCGVVLALFVLVVSPLYALDAPGDLDDLKSKQSGVRARAEKQLVLRRKMVIERLVKIVETESDLLAPDAPIFCAARLLGQMRAAEAVDILINKIDTTSLIKTDFPGYPMGYALIEIGKPASRKAILRLRAEKKPLRRSILLQVIKHVEGESLAVFLIESDIENKMGVSEKENLKRALAELKTGKHHGLVSVHFDQYKANWKRYDR